MMNFYYDPILGLKYEYLGELFIIDLECLPKDIEFDSEQFLKYFRQTGVQLISSSKESSIEVLGRVTNYIL